MKTLFTPAYENLTMRYHEITVYFIIRQSYALASKPFENSWIRFSGDY